MAPTEPTVAHKVLLVDDDDAVRAMIRASLEHKGFEVVAAASHRTREDLDVCEPTRKGRDPHIVALVELDMQKMRVHIVLSREAIRQRLQELQYPLGTTTGISCRVARVEELRKL
jgi:CheY-like chemotaxis protein